MTASLTEPRRLPWSAALLILALAMAAGPASAENAAGDGTGGEIGRPTPLFPGSDSLDSDGVGAPAPDLDTPRAPEGLEVERLDEAGPRAPQGIAVDALAAIDPATVGALTERDPGGFGADVWQGLDRVQVRTLLRATPPELKSPALRDALRRLLLTSAAPPRGAAPAELEAPTILGLRAELLFALGDTPALIRLLSVAPEGAGDELLDRVRLQAQLITGREQAACRLGRRGVADYGGVWWSKALIFCQLAAGEEDAAMLGLDLLRERGSEEADRDFLQLASAMVGLGAAPKRPEPTALNLAMLAKLQARPDLDLLEEVPLGRVEQVLGLQSLPAGPRLALAERATAAGALPGDRLADLYDLFDFAPETLQGALGAELDPNDLRDRALLFRALMRPQPGVERAELLRQYFAGMRGAGLQLAGLQAALAFAVELSPEPTLARQAAAPGRTLFYGERLEQAVAWVALARDAAGQWPGAAGALQVLWPYARLAGTPGVGWETLPAWSAEAQAAGIDAQTVGLLAAGLYALGDRAAIAEAGLTALTGTPPETPQLELLRDAAEAGRLGETLLRAAAVVGNRGAHELHPLTLAAVVEALVAIDLASEARHFAIEALASRGL
ncbi:hypothetical protein AY599_06520 [Leptolyngbya valderiana BDU 20041]|nr:hypothetical protein AY599_06520 [Leptolyngbya valderiana BDU 20041]